MDHCKVLYSGSLQIHRDTCANVPLSAEGRQARRQTGGPSESGGYQRGKKYE